MITTQKNSRLLQILGQTHKFLEQLGAKVSVQKAENQLKQKKRKIEDEALGLEEDKDGEEVVQLDEFGNPIEKDNEEIDDNERIKSNLKNSSKVYYAVTHTIQEEITEQPKMLKGGQLKSY